MGLLAEPYGAAKKEVLNKDEAVAIVQDLLALLADNFGEELDRMTLGRASRAPPSLDALSLMRRKTSRAR